MTMNTAWAIGELNYFIFRCQQHSADYDRAGEAALGDQNLRLAHDGIIGRMPIIEQIAGRTGRIACPAK